LRSGATRQKDRRGQHRRARARFHKPHVACSRWLSGKRHLPDLAS
jgi:hypothetical protein